MEKYKLTKETRTIGGTKVFRVKALIDISNVRKGYLGGFVILESPEKLKFIK